MWLLNVNTLELEEFFGEKTPRYAILSHTWGQGEVSFVEWQQLQTHQDHDPATKALKEKRGYRKIINTCDFVRNSKLFRLEHVWIDTVCIDKRSSAELSEAINSMFQWYKNSRLCVVYMDDVQISSNDLRDYHFPLEESSGTASAELPATTRERFLRSRWFTRGWTLQELLAPKKLLYVSHDWTPIGTQEALISYVSDASRVPIKILRGEQHLNEISVAKRMSWASSRETTRLEDAAYCLMGIFDVNMPLLYGEGSKAFRRLQMEIIKESDDHSLFTWDAKGRGSIFAPSPQAFKLDGYDIARAIDLASERRPYYLSNVGLFLTLPLIKTADEQISIAVLNCIAKRSQPGRNQRRFHLILRKLGTNRYHALGAIPLGFWSFDLSSLRRMDQKIYLETMNREYRPSSYIPSREYKWRPTGRPYMLTSFWALGDCTIDLMTLDHGTWQFSPSKCRDGISWLYATGHASGMQLVVVQIRDGQTREGLWFAVAHHPDYDWFVYGLGYGAPSATSYEALAEQILIQMYPVALTANTISEISMANNMKEHYYDYRVERPTWPLAYTTNFELDDCPLVFIRITP